MADKQTPIEVEFLISSIAHHGRRVKLIGDEIVSPGLRLQVSTISFDHVAIVSLEWLYQVKSSILTIE